MEGAAERAGSAAALPPYAVARVLADEFGVTDPETGLQVEALTGGRPALVRLAGSCLQDLPAVDALGVVDALAAPGAPTARWVDEHALADLGRSERAVLAAVARLGPLTPETCRAVADGLPGAPDVAGLVRRLPAAALVVPEPGAGPTVPRLLPLLGEVLVREHPSVGIDPAAAQRLLDQHGEDLLRAGGAAEVVRLVEQATTAVGAPPDALAPVLRTYADALRMAGDATRALRAFAPLVAAAPPGRWSPGLASRVAAVHYLRGEFETAVKVLDQAAATTGPDSEDLVDWLACRTHVLAASGRHEECREVAAGAVDVAERLGQDRPLGTAHLAAARACRGTRREVHYDAAVRHATAGGDLATVARIRAAQAHLLLAAARYEEAAAVGRDAVRLTRRWSPPGQQAVALHNLGEALARMGQLDEALWHLRCSVAVCRRLGPARAALGLVGVAGVHRLLGHDERGRAALAEALDLARGSGDTQVLVAALTGLATLGASADDALPTDGPAAAEEAVALATPDLQPAALTAQGWLALRSRPGAAAEVAARAVAAARASGAADLLAEALELSAAATDDPAVARSALLEALAVWESGGALPAAARVEVLLGGLSDADATDRARARHAVRRLRTLGIGRVHGRPLGRVAGGDDVAIRVLGQFAVTVGGTEVPLRAWRSKQARTLVKILAAHRGRVVARERLCHLLWPEEHDAGRTGHRLSVILAAVRGVLDPDRTRPADHFVAADQFGLRLDLGHVTLDADVLLGDAAYASRLLADGDAPRAAEVLAHVCDLYTGDAFEDEPDEEWADGLREQARAAWARSARQLTTLDRHQTRGPDALGLLVRLLAVDPYDEQVHRRLVRTLLRRGRHGEAGRAFDRWCEAMREIDAPEPDPADLGLPARGPRRAVPVLTSR